MPIAANVTLPTYPKVTDIKASTRQYIQSLQPLLTNFNPGGAFATYIDALSINMGSDASSIPNNKQLGAYEILTQVQNSAFIDTATGTWLDLKCLDVGVTRRPPVASSGTVVFSSAIAPNVTLNIPIGTVVASPNPDPSQPSILFQTTATSAIQAGQNTSPAVPITALAAGSSGNLITGLISVVVTNLGSVAVTNPSPTTGGQDIEGDDTPNGGLRARGLAAVPNASQCTISAIQVAALGYPGIVSATLQDNTALDSFGNTFFQRGSCLLYVDDGTGELGNPSLGNPVNRAILAQLNADLTAGKYRAAGVQVTAVGANSAFISIQISISIGATWLTTHTQASVVLAVQQAITNMVNVLPMNAPVLLAELVATAKDVPGVSNVDADSIVYNNKGPSQGGVSPDFFPPANQVLRISGVNFVTVNVTGVTTYA